MERDIERYRDAYQVGWDVIRKRRLKRMRKMGLVDCGLSELQPDMVPRYSLNAK